MNFVILTADRKQRRYLMSVFYEFSTATLRFERERVCSRICKFIRMYICMYVTSVRRLINVVRLIF